MFLANPGKASAVRQERERRRKERRKANELKQRGVMGKREAREKGIWKLDPAQAKSVPPFISQSSSSVIRDMHCFCRFTICG